MELIVYQIEEGDYASICKWWEFWRFPIVPLGMLPNRGLGGLKLVDQNNRVCAVGFLYETNSLIAWLEFIVINPAIKDREERNQAKTEIIRYLTMWAEKKGYHSVFSSIREDFLLENFKEVGYVPSEKNKRELIIKLV